MAKNKTKAVPGKALVVSTNNDDVKLAAKIVDAFKELDAADAVKKEKAIAAGRLLAEAQKRHPGKKAFQKFLELAGGVRYGRAMDLIAVALGRKDYEQQRAENAANVQRHRDKLKAEREKAEAEPAEPSGALRNAQQTPADDNVVAGESDYDELHSALRLLATIADHAECNRRAGIVIEPIEPWVFPQIVADIGSEELHRIIKMLQAACEQQR
jgi:hypothetical protein